MSRNYGSYSGGGSYGGSRSYGGGSSSYGSSGSSYGSSSRSYGGSSSYGSSGSSYGSSSHSYGGSTGSSYGSSTGSSSYNSGGYSSRHNSGGYSGSTGGYSGSTGSSSSSGSSYGTGGYTGRHSSGSSSSTGGYTGSTGSSSSTGGYTGRHSSGSSSSTGGYSGSTGSTSRRGGNSSGGYSSGGYSSGSTSRYAGNSSYGYNRRSDSYTSRANSTHIQQQTDILRRGGNYHRDLSYDTHVSRTTVIINNNHYYQPRYYDHPYHAYTNRYNSWGGGFWAGYMAGSINQSNWDNYYGNWNSVRVGSYWAVPYTTWNPYYTNVLALPLLVDDIDYARPESWQHPPLNANQDPLEQLASFHELKKPGFWGSSEISAEEARARLANGDKVEVAGVSVTSYDQLAQIVPEMAKGNQVQGSQLPPEAQQAVAASLQPSTTAPTTTVNDLTVDDLVNKLPAFAKVYSPRTLSAEEQVNGKNINRTMDSAEAVYNRPEVQAALAQWWKENPDADRDTLNRQINRVVTKALVDDLSANASKYAQEPTLSSNPVDYLKDPTSDTGAVAYNQQAIQTVLTNATDMLSKNLISKTTATLGQ